MLINVTHLVRQIRKTLITLLVLISCVISASGKTHATTSLARYDADCDFFQNVQIDQTYYVYSPNYPGSYSANTNCRWTAAAPRGYLIILDCQVNISVSDNCQNDRLEVSRSGQPDLSDAQRYCGSGSFVSESQATQLVIALTIPSESNGGNFLCSLRAVQGTTESGFTELCQCGRKKNTRIVGGQETGVNEYPMMAGLVDVSNDQPLLYCGATIIARNYAVSAAHCVTDRDITKLGLVVGEHDTTTGKDTNYTKVFLLADIIVHPRYDSNSNANDIAMLRTPNFMTFDEGVSAVCLPFRSGIMMNTFANETVEALGWGTTSFGGPVSTTLQKVALNVISNAKCRPTYPNLMSSQMCTFTRDKDTCQLDSGGPLLYTNPSNGLLFLAAIVSYGNGCASLSPSVNIRVTSYLPWIVMNSPGVIYCLK